MASEATKTDDGGPAFPQLHAMDMESATRANTIPGMTLRDWFAGLAMQGIIIGLVSRGVRLRQEDGEERLAYEAYVAADKMLAARKAGAQ